jgi:hypothetical protein
VDHHRIALLFHPLDEFALPPSSSGDLVPLGSSRFVPSFYLAVVKRNFLLGSKRNFLFGRDTDYGQVTGRAKTGYTGSVLEAKTEMPVYDRATRTTPVVEE